MLRQIGRFGEPFPASFVMALVWLQVDFIVKDGLHLSAEPAQPMQCPPSANKNESYGHHACRPYLECGPQVAAKLEKRMWKSWSIAKPNRYTN